MNTRYLLIPILVLAVISAGCISAPSAVDSSLQPLDYGLTENWVMIANNSADQKAVDVFYLYPTLYRVINLDAMNTSDPAMRSSAVRDVMMKKGVFEDTANVYAPFYRQTGIFSMIGNGTWTKDQYIAEKRAYEDAKAAFLYYLDHYNEGKPFILAAHSQGSYRLKQLMEDIFVDPELQEKLVAAYAIGYTFSEFELAQYPQMKAAAGENDTGVIITFNTQAQNVSGKNILVLPGAVGINPLNWKTDETYASAEENDGAVFFYSNASISAEVPNFTGAYLKKENGSAVLIVDDSVNRTQYSTAGLFDEGVYHTSDYNFFYENLKENVADRTAAYLSQAAA